MTRKKPDRDDYNMPRHTNDSPIAQLRIERGMTQQDLADALGVRQQQIGFWETGFRKPKLESVAKMASVLGVDLAELLEAMGRMS